MTIREIMEGSEGSETPYFLIATFEARQRISHGGSLVGGIGVDAVRPKLPHLEVHRDTTYRPEEEIGDDIFEDELTETVVDATEEYPPNETLIPLLEHVTRHGGRVIQGCENNTVETLYDGSVNLLPPETAQLELHMQLGTPLTIL